MLPGPIWAPMRDARCLGYIHLLIRRWDSHYSQSYFARLAVGFETLDAGTHFDSFTGVVRAFPVKAADFFQVASPIRQVPWSSGFSEIASESFESPEMIVRGILIHALYF